MSTNKKEQQTLDISMPFRDAKEIVRICVEKQEPIMIWGGPGIGKSDMIFELGRETGREVIDIRLCLYENVDIKGYPFIDHETKKLNFAYSGEFPDDPNSTAIMFFDEINAADPATQKACYQLFLNRRIGNYILPKGVSLVAAGNREQDKGGVFSMPKPLENRFVHVEMRHSFRDWFDWALGAGLNKDVLAFLNKMQDRIYTFEPGKSQRSFATPRSWTKASKLITGGNMDASTIKKLVSGCVGEGTAIEFMAFKETVDKLPDPNEIIEGRLKSLEKIDTSLVYALIIGCLYRLREIYQTSVLDKHPGVKFSPDTKEFKEFGPKYDNLLRFLYENDDVIGPEFVAMAIAMAASTYKIPPNRKHVPVVDEIMNDKKYKDFLDVALRS